MRIISPGKKQDLYILKSIINGLAAENKKINRKLSHEKNIAVKRKMRTRKLHIRFTLRVHALCYAILSGKKYSSVEPNKSMIGKVMSASVTKLEIVSNMANCLLCHNKYWLPWPYAESKKAWMFVIYKWLSTDESLNEVCEKLPKMKMFGTEQQDFAIFEPEVRHLIKEIKMEKFVMSLRADEIKLDKDNITTAPETSFISLPNHPND